ncbi:hypothetical protein HZ326_22392 [Fusarium oxysporum f. sp. albedinis]|nr:hypothetical protein HZ326_22392 [Fusarium oxysporum f. sp. albedinis]
MSNKKHSGNVMRFAPPDHWRILAPLNNVAEDQARFEVENSPLSEFGALDFKYGGTLAAPNSLVMWESHLRIVFISFFSKSLLHHPLTRSDIADFNESSAFQSVIIDPEYGHSLDDPKAIQPVIICAG